ncbi:MAG: hypothetical protein HYR63_15850 [Proteobacteria bacterium]|nr:hypothetical protein [Pseudomonadota bacterium]MBI3499687.1 hypothetical protein [Pseudomonadota bacterium]
MEGTGRWVFSGIVGIIGIVGLMAAARAHESVFYWSGLMLFVFSVLLVMATVKRCFDRQELPG